MDRHGTREAELRSGLYRGSVRHLRTGPRPHRFRVPLHYLYLDLDELETIFARRLLWSHEAPNLVSFRRRDYHGDPDVPLDQAVRRSVAAEIGREVVGPIRMLTHLRHFGFVFNPVTFYYCYAADGETLEAVLAEITNTPWGERHAYALDLVAAPVESPAPRSGAATWWRRSIRSGSGNRSSSSTPTPRPRKKAVRPCFCWSNGPTATSTSCSPSSSSRRRRPSSCRVRNCPARNNLTVVERCKGAAA
ncbi:MAG: DUF1365 domain-containing protein, partial [Planctomycetota bacterium]